MKLITCNPVVMAPRADGFEVVWSVSEPARGWIEWQDASGRTHVVNLDRYGFVPQGTEIIRVRVDGLAPGTELQLRAVSAAKRDGRVEASAWRAVRTLDPLASSSSFVVWNDTHQQADTLALLRERSPEADVWVWNGDICNDWTDPDQLIPTVLPAADGEAAPRPPMAFVWGNHDVRGPWAYRLPEVIATPHNRPYYALRHGPVAAIFLNTGEDKPDAHPSFAGTAAFEQLRRQQADWLGHVLTQPGFVDAPYRVVFCHLPLRWLDETLRSEADYFGRDLWDRFAASSRAQWHEALSAWGAQVIISGHTHQPTLLSATSEFGYVQFTGGGHRPENATWIELKADSAGLQVSTHRLSDGETLLSESFAQLTGERH